MTAGAPSFSEASIPKFPDLEELLELTDGESAEEVSGKHN
jgi:hypothetical protein